LVLEGSSDLNDEYGAIEPGYITQDNGVSVQLK
jgi:hypothetical protein